MEIKIISAKDFKKKPNQEEVWDSIAVPWKKYVVKTIPIVEEFLKGKKGKIVDLGCGSGRNIIPNPKVKYYAVDFSSKQLKHAKEYVKSKKIKAKIFKSSLDKLPSEFKDKMFDYGLFIATLHCIDGSLERKNALKEFYRILKPNAEGLISVWNSEDKRFDCVGNHGEVYMSWKENGMDYMRYYYLYKKQELLSLLKKTGFKILEVYKSREKDRFSRKNWIIKIRK